MFEEEEQDDEYYDEEDDEYYDEEEEPEGGGGRGVVLVLVAMLVLLALGGVFVGIFFLTDVGRGGGAASTEGATPPDAAVAATAQPEQGDAALLDDGAAALDLELFAAATDAKDAASMKVGVPPVPTPSGPAATPAAVPVRDQWEAESTARTSRASEPATPRYTEPPSERRTADRSSGSQSSQGSTSGRGGTTSSGSASSTPRSSSSSGYTEADEGRVIDDGRSARGGRSSSSSGSTSSSATPTPTPARSTPAPTPQPTPARTAEPTPARTAQPTPARTAEPTPARAAEPTPERAAEPTPEPAAPPADLTYEHDSIASLGGKAGSGDLSDGELGHLKGIPKDNANYTFAWATVMKNAEAKRDYKGHCDAAAKVMELPANKYHPEWNLEMGKCQMRNGQWEAAVRSIDMTLADSMSMSGSTKTQRVLTAYEIKAVCRTRLYDDSAAANSGAGDDAKLAQAIQAWTEYRNYASGIGNSRALQRAEREITDLSARKEP